MHLATLDPISRLNGSYQLGWIQLMAHRPADARESLEQALAVLDTHRQRVDEREWRRQILAHLGDVYRALGEHDRAVSTLRELLPLCPDGHPARARTLLSLGHALYGAGALADARAAYEAVLADPNASDDDRADAGLWRLWAVGDAHWRAEEYEAAARVFQDLLEHYRDDADRLKVLRRLGYCWFKLGDFARARRSYEEVATSRLAPDEERADARDLADRSEACELYDAGRYADAAAAFERVLDRLSDEHPEWCAWLLWLAACYTRVGAHRAARDCYAEILRVPQATEAQQEKARYGLRALDESTE